MSRTTDHPLWFPLRELWRRRWFVLLGLLTLGGIVWGARVLGARVLTLRIVAQLRDAGPPAFFAAMALLPAVGFPLLPFALAAGPVFVPTLGVGGVIACAVCAVGVNVALSYFLAATWLRLPTERLLRRLGYRLPDTPPGRDAVLVLLVRLAPGLPFWAQSYLLGLMCVRFGPYLLVSTLVPAGYLTGAIVFGEAMLQGRLGAAFFGTGLVVAAGTAMYLLRRKFSGAVRPRVPRGAVLPENESERV